MEGYIYLIQINLIIIYISYKKNKKSINYNYNLTIKILAINNLNILGNKYLDIINIKIDKANIPKVNKCKK